jgi:hypothetical protein
MKRFIIFGLLLLFACPIYSGQERFVLLVDGRRDHSHDHCTHRRTGIDNGGTTVVNVACSSNFRDSPKTGNTERTLGKQGFMLLVNGRRDKSHDHCKHRRTGIDRDGTATIELDCGLIFRDGFEKGNAKNWR